MSKPKVSAPSKHHCWTLNNPTDETHIYLMSLCKEKHGVTYLIYGREIAPTTGTPHLQGYICMVDRKRVTGMRKIIPGAHFMAAKGTSQENIAYCSKEDPEPYIYGNVSEVKGSQGKRTDYDSFLADLKSGVLDEDYLQDKYPKILANTPNYFWSQITRHTPVEPIKEYPLFEWQEKLKRVLDSPSDDRTIIFIVDEKGNSGKTWFAHYYTKLRNELKPKSASVLYPGKLSDMSQAYIPSTEVLFMDCARKRAENLQYGFLEEIKNGQVFKAKYNSCMLACKVPHVVVNMNQLPDMEALSGDRYVVYIVERPCAAPAVIDTRALYADIDHTEEALSLFNDSKSNETSSKKRSWFNEG
jgi:hypothetical protein